MNQDYKQLAKQELEEEKRREAELKARPLMLKKKFARVSNEDLQTLKRNFSDLNATQYWEVEQEIKRRAKVKGHRGTLMKFEKKYLTNDLSFVKLVAKAVLPIMDQSVEPNNKRWALIKRMAEESEKVDEPVIESKIKPNRVEDPKICDNIKYEEPDYLKCDPSTGGCLFISLLVLGSALATIVISIIISIALTK